MPVQRAYITPIGLLQNIWGSTPRWDVPTGWNAHVHIRKGRAAALTMKMIILLPVRVAAPRENPSPDGSAGPTLPASSCKAGGGWGLIKFRVEGFGFKLSGFRVQGLGCGAQGSSSGFKVSGLRFGV